MKYELIFKVILAALLLKIFVASNPEDKKIVTILIYWDKNNIVLMFDSRF